MRTGPAGASGTFAASRSSDRTPHSSVKQKVYLVCPNSQFDGPNNGEGNARPGDEPRRKPYASVFDATNKNVDFKSRDGVAFLNRDDSLSLLIGDRGDAQQLKYQMREVRRFKQSAAKA